ncbi:MAG: NYN domain-containing protein [Pseudomonadota bacterium]
MDYIYIDNSNLYIEGRRVSAVRQGHAESIIHAMNDGILDHAYTISFGKLHEFVCGTDKRTIKRAALFGSRPPPNDGIWEFAKKAGFELHLEDRNYSNKEKKIDTGIATLLTKDAYKSEAYRNGRPSDDTFVLVAGDSDYVPTINELKADGFNVEVIFWDHASRELREVASKFVGLDKFLENLRI